MGMFDKDKEIGTVITSLFTMGEPFILFAARIKREDFPTDIGPAVQTELRVAKRENPTDTFIVTTLASAIATKVREAEPGDFPAVVCLNRVDSKKYAGRQALVLQFLKPWDAQENGRQATLDDAVKTGSVPTEPRPTVADDDIPF